jgi:hypothetical protein
LNRSTTYGSQNLISNKKCRPARKIYEKWTTINIKNEPKNKINKSLHP